MTDIGHIDTARAWEAPEPNRRTMGVMFERDITPTEQLAAGFGSGGGSSWLKVTHSGGEETSRDPIHRAHVGISISIPDVSCNRGYAAKPRLFLCIDMNGGSFGWGL